MKSCVELLNQLFCQRIVFTERWMRHDIWYLNMFLLHDLIVFDHLFVIVKRLSRQHDCFLVNCFVKKIIFAKRWMSKRVMILNYFRINCIIERLYSSCYWFSDIFLLYNLFETWSFILIVKRLSRRNTDMIIWIICSNQSYHRKDCICRAIDFQIRFRCTILFFDFILCQCRCFIVNARILDVCF